MRFRLLALALALATLAGTAGSGQAAKRRPSDLWLHISVHEEDAEARVLVTVPLGLVEGVLPFLQGDKVARGRIQMSDVDGADLREAWDLAHSAPEGTYVPVPTRGDGKLAVTRNDGQLVFKAVDDDSEVRIRMPLTVAKRLVAVSDEGETAEVDLASLLRALREFGPGELLAAEDGESLVRIWIDRDQGESD
jgi:hypothetical protein